MFNKKRQSEITTLYILVFDKSMSAFVPRYVIWLFYYIYFSTKKLTYYANHTSFFLPSFRTTATGGLPNLSFITRKPEPLGTEFKILVDGFSGQMIWLEIQEGGSRIPKGVQ